MNGLLLLESQIENSSWLSRKYRETFNFLVLLLMNFVLPHFLVVGFMQPGFLST